MKMEPVQTSLTPVQTADLDQRAVGLFKLVSSLAIIGFSRVDRVRGGQDYRCVQFEGA